MWRIFFGEVASGRLKRLQYLGYSILLNLIVFAIVITAIMLVGGVEQASDDPMAMQRRLLERFGSVGMLAMSLLMFVFLFAGLNLMAKRLRDMGLPGWPGVLGLMLIAMLLALMLGGGAAGMGPGGGMTMNLIQLAILAFLLLVPSDAFGSGRGPDDGEGRMLG